MLPAFNPRHIPPTDFSHAGQLIAPALEAARAALTGQLLAPFGPLYAVREHPAADMASASVA